ncbi:MAG: bifunctional folylpolyglutamate synthase/dihydrofolate synthase, partial [Bhargavaea sp.]
MIPKLDFYQKKHELMSADEIRPGLEAMEEALEKLGHPERGPRFIHVAGTNGKGSTVAFMESIAREHGLRTGSFTSPAITDLQDQIRLDARPITEKEADAAFAEMKKAGISGL